MLAFLKMVADFSRRCAHSATGPPISASHTHRLTSRELVPATTSPSKGNGADEVLSAPLPRQILSLRHKLVDVIVGLRIDGPGRSETPPATYLSLFSADRSIAREGHRAVALAP